MLNKRYDLQLVLYLLALHRLLKVRLGASYDYDTHIGGGLYLFLRGVYNKSKGLILEKPPFELIEHLDMLFKGTLDDI
jgi:exodeoxyribonuclease V beta subunit